MYNHTQQTCTIFIKNKNHKSIELFVETVSLFDFLIKLRFSKLVILRE